MVLIIDGEIVQDNDPRAVARHKPAAPTPTAPTHAPQCRAPPAVAAAAAAAAAAAGRALDALANAIGVQDKSSRSLPLLRSPAAPCDDPPVLLGAATLFFGWRVLAVAAVLHVISG